jgi:transporter family-2 protein
MIAFKYAAWAAATGALIPVMAVLNSRLGAHLENPLHASVILFGVGLMACAGVSIFLSGSLPDFAKLSSVRPLQLAGGLIVCFYVISATLLAPKFGVGNFILVAVAAQVISSAFIDHFGLFGAAIRPVNLLRLGGILLLLIGLVITQVANARTV